MRSLSDTITRLSAARIRRAAGPISGASSVSGLTELRDFGSNPGALGAWYYVPASARTSMPLVVVLHGCTQDAASYDQGAGWSQLADEQGFAVLFPEQRRSNNMNLCFNWYEPADRRRDAGEPLSIRQMIAAMVERHGIDPARVYVNGLSAGGAMTSVILATYPDLFAGGAIIAGLAFDVAAGVPQAFDRMRGHGGPKAAALAASIRHASSHEGPWPTISVWHGSADHIVDPSNAEAILAQWRPIHSVAVKPSRVEQIDGHQHRVWENDQGRVVIEEYRITGMGHGTPLATRGDDRCGNAGAHMLEAGISSTRHIARSWGLMGDSAGRAVGHTVAARTPHPERGAGQIVANDRVPLTPPAASGVGMVIEDALRAAGLMR